MNQVKNRFEKGSGVYTCRMCSRKTRATGEDNQYVQLCYECFDLAGIENQISDHGSTPELESKRLALRKAVLSKGGKL